MTDNTDILVRRFIDGDLAGEDEAEALRRIADDSEARRLLRFERRLGEEFSASRPAKIPEGFAARTMSAIRADAREHMIAESSSGSWIQWVWNALMEPRAVSIRPAYGIVTAVFLVVMLGVFVGRSGPESEPATAEYALQASTESSAETELVATRFTYVDNEATSVAVAGDFTEWEPIPLTSREVDGQQVWRAVLPLPKGEHQYMFVIDGERWVTDPLAPVQREDGFGHRNAVISL